jgi:ABC-type multidrug transport system ATPase subunit
MAVVLTDVTLTYHGLLSRGLKCVKRRDDSVRALDGVSLRADAASIYGLLGPSGCGKTSLLSCCLGVTAPDSGVVSVLGRPPRSPLQPPSKAVPGAGVGYMPQSASLHAFLTPTELLRYYGQIFQVAGLDERVRELLDLVELRDGKVRPKVAVYLVVRLISRVSHPDGDASRGPIERRTVAATFLGVRTGA